MRDFLAQLGALSLGGGAVILLLLGAGHLMRMKYAARWRCVGWLLLCLRLAVPVSLFSLLPAQQAQPAAPIRLELPSDRVIYTYQPPAVRPSLPAQGGTTGGEQVAAPGDSAVPAAPAAQQPSVPAFTLSLSQLLFLLWLLGAAAVLVWAAVSHLRLLRYLRRWAGPVREPDTLRLFDQIGDQLHLHARPALRQCRGLRVPTLAGLLSPVLLLPEEPLDPQSLRYSILHELTHFRRRDIWLKTLALWVRAIHWFDPLMWLMAGAIERDTELACDEASLTQLPQSEHAAYGRTILAAAQQIKAPTTAERSQP